MQSLIGQTLTDRYEIKEKIGQGGSSTIFLAYDLHLLRLCAIKKNLDATPEAQRQFATEVRILATTRHQNLPHVYDYFSTDAGQFMVMEYIDGWSLNQLTRKKPDEVSVGQILGWIDQVCDVLEYLHQQTPPIIHRDIKPANIIIRPDDQAILVDFGISKVYRQDRKTSIGAHRLTSGYAPPEQYGIGSSKTDVRSDVYSIGATLYALLTRKRPPEAIERIANGVEISPIETLNPAVSSDIASVVRRAMALSMDDRFQTITAFRHALKTPSVAEIAPMPPTEPTEGKPVSTGRVVFLSITLGLLALMVIVSIAFGQWVVRSDGSSTLAQSAIVSASATVPIAVLETASPSPFATSTPTQTPSPTPTRKPTATRTPTATSTPRTIRIPYTLQRGENLYSLAMRYNADINEIIKLNGIINSRSLSLGQEIIIPANSGGDSLNYTVYTVQPGDTLAGIALEFDVSIASIQLANSILDPRSLMVGQLLIIPPSEQQTESALKPCNTRSSAEFAYIWDLYREYLGCPTGSEFIVPQIAEEAFEGGHLFWRSDNGAVYVIYDQDPYRSYPAGVWFQIPSSWRWDGHSNPNGIGLNPPSGYVEPVRGFGWLWRTYLGGPSGDLGWALDKEYGFANLAKVQSFENGLIFKGSSDRVYALLPYGYFSSD